MKKIIWGECEGLIQHNEVCENPEYSCKATGSSGIFWVIQKKTPQHNARVMALPAGRQNTRR